MWHGFCAGNAAFPTSWYFSTRSPAVAVPYLDLVGGELEAMGTPAKVAAGLGGEDDGKDEAGHFVGGVQGLAADLGVVNHARGRHAAAQEGNTLRQALGGDAPRLEHEDEDAGGIVAPHRSDLVHSCPRISCELGAGRYEEWGGCR